jgi:hypothetical protein
VAERFRAPVLKTIQSHADQFYAVRLRLI